MLGHIADLVDVDHPLRELPLTIDSREAILVAASDDRLEG